MARLVEQFERLLPWVRSQFPQIESLRSGERRTYLDNAAGTLVPRAAADAMAEAALWSNPQPGRAWPAGPQTTREHRHTRQLLRDLLNADAADAIFLSESTTASLYKLREALEPRWTGEDNVVVTDADHFANISPWEWRARWEVRRTPMLPDGHLDLDALAGLLDASTRVVALGLASNGLGTVVRAADAIRLVRERAPDAVVVVDGVHAAPHLPLDVATLGADALAFSTYKLFGPNCGVCWMRADLAARLEPFRVEPHTDAETQMEWGTLSNASVAGIRAALEYLLRVGERLEPAMVGELREYPRQQRLFKIALSAFAGYEAVLSRHMLGELRGIPGLTLYGVTDPERVGERVPTFAFSIDGVPDAELEERLWKTSGVQVAAGSHYAASVLRGLGRASVGRASFAHYNTVEEAEALLYGLRTVAGASAG